MRQVPAQPRPAPSPPLFEPRVAAGFAGSCCTSALHCTGARGGVQSRASRRLGCLCLLSKGTFSLWSCPRINA